jgi:hypothetical protein
MFGGLARRRLDQVRQPTSNAIGPGSSAGLFKRVVVFGPDGSGIFVYSPSPGAGNLIASIAAQAGTDPYGNPYQAGITSYNGSAYISISQSVIFFSNGALIEQTATSLNIGTSASIDFNIDIPVGDPIVALQPGTTGTGESWHALALGNGWTGTFQYKLETNSKVSIRSVGSLAAGTLTNGTVIGTIPAIPAGYWPASNQQVDAIISSVGAGSAATGNSPYFLVNTAGQILVENMAVQVPTNVRLNGNYALD